MYYINVVRTDPLGSIEIPMEYRKKAVEVTFDMEPKVKHKEEIYTELNESFRVHKNEPYPHFLINSTLNCGIVKEDVMKISESEVQSVLMDRPKYFRFFYSQNYRIIIEKNNIIFDTCGGGFNTRSGIGLVGNELEFEVPSRPFKKIFKFICSSNTNFEIIKPIKYPEFIIHNDYFTTYASFGRDF